MKKILPVEVKTKHIKKGKPGSTMFDPIALAIRDQYFSLTANNFFRVNVYYEMIWIEENHRVFKYIISKRACKWLRRFDNNKLVKPQNFKFQLL